MAAKKGNQYALIHGLYSGLIARPEKAQLKKLNSSDIKGEIAYLRVICSRLAKIAERNGLEYGAIKTLDDRTIRTLNALDLKLNTLLRYIRTHAFLNGGNNEYDRQIEEGEFLARKRRNVFNYLSTRKEAQPSDGSSFVDDV